VKIFPYFFSIVVATFTTSFANLNKIFHPICTSTALASVAKMGQVLLQVRFPSKPEEEKVEKGEVLVQISSEIFDRYN